MNIALIVFAGTGSRMNLSIPKQFVKINGKELVCYTIEKFINHPLIDEIVLVTHKDYLTYVKELVKKYNYHKVKHIVSGGPTRQESVRLGLISYRYKDDDKVLIHDGDRPLVSETIISNNLKELDYFDVVCTSIKHKDALKEVSNLGRTKVIEGEDNDIQTPQSFRYGIISKYHELKKEESFSDDIGLVEADYKVKYVLGSPYNFKVTLDDDLKVLQSMIK